MELVKDKRQIVANVLRFDSYSRSSFERDINFYGEHLRLGNQLVCLRQNSIRPFCLRQTTPQINRLLGDYSENNNTLEKEFLKRCNELSLTPANRQRGYWLVQGQHAEVEMPPFVRGDVGFPDELTEDPSFVVSGVKRVLVNRYERDPTARRLCIEHYGAQCHVCRIDFGYWYPTIGEGFIHVHHLKPETLRQPGYKVDPIMDLIPVCPNCHAMLHSDDPPLSPDELRELMGGWTFDD